MYLLGVGMSGVEGAIGLSSEVCRIAFAEGWIDTEKNWDRSSIFVCYVLFARTRKTARLNDLLRLTETPMPIRYDFFPYLIPSLHSSHPQVPFTRSPLSTSLSTFVFL